MGVLTYIFTLASLALCANAAYPFLPISREIPGYIAPAAAFTAFFIALIWYFDIKARERAKKKRKKAVIAMTASLAACAITLAYLLSGMIRTYMLH